MAKYIMLLNWTDQGIKTVKDSPKRLDAAREVASKLGCTIESFYMTMGAHDMVVILEAPNDEAAALFALRTASGGNVRPTTLKAVAEDAYRKVIAGV